MALRRGVGSLAGPESSPYRPRTTLEFGPEKSRYSVLLAHQKKPGPIGNKKNPNSCYSRLPASHSHAVTTHGARPHAPRSQHQATDAGRSPERPRQGLLALAPSRLARRGRAATPCPASHKTRARPASHRATAAFALGAGAAKLSLRAAPSCTRCPASGPPASRPPPPNSGEDCLSGRAQPRWQPSDNIRTTC